MCIRDRQEFLRARSIAQTLHPRTRCLKNAIVCALTKTFPEMKFTNPGTDEISGILRCVQTIAVVGLSPNRNRPSFRVASAMKDRGYRILPVRPLVKEVLGEPAYARLEDIPFKVDLVNVFRASEHVPGIVESCIALGIKRLWLQDGVIHEEAAQRAQAAGITVVMNRCILRDHFQFCEQRHD